MIEVSTAEERITGVSGHVLPAIVSPSAKATRFTLPHQGRCPSRRTISRDLLAAMERSNPLEAALASLLVKEGTWALAE